MLCGASSVNYEHFPLRPAPLHLRLIQWIMQGHAVSLEALLLNRAGYESYWISSSFCCHCRTSRVLVKSGDVSKRVEPPQSENGIAFLVLQYIDVILHEAQWLDMYIFLKLDIRLKICGQYMVPSIQLLFQGCMFFVTSRPFFRWECAMVNFNKKVSNQYELSFIFKTVQFFQCG